MKRKWVQVLQGSWLRSEVEIFRSGVLLVNRHLAQVLRDSLGGNCKTSMIATMNPDRNHTDEGMSTCRFAQVLQFRVVQFGAILDSSTTTFSRKVKRFRGGLVFEIYRLKPSTSPLTFRVGVSGTV